jgi:hypothetical protein
MNHTSHQAQLFTAAQVSRSLCACAFMALALISAGAMAAQPCISSAGNAGFLPGNGGLGGNGGYRSIICGLPASQNPVIGAGAEQERKRAEQRAAWSRSLKEGQQAIPVKADEPVPPHTLMLPGTKD